ncbi:hypothetical protein SERLA73DRAFT_187994 [Serpula lacrymans var. lacrymans S7.3]|uniref:Choline kinase N-terminal domain-containing protein n=2 Tax=Serpula lacrymans var. lacrymans TaxID=341189 RepID=F8Q9Z1_SERL3|nr:uncharacterized protein SERLADRAFT_477932 [Serpula lacrymans var. lacrymans S7.9]EGN94896.1 hypothetical protein SERLA73DRAFT_187994 [Serpula lacrymans var. lacrymans S7.3]EGO20396.1 hypothetical protein SERLADRAFT_477932 [Serpula lacrymans var. lacrymans S7.9]
MSQLSPELLISPCASISLETLRMPSVSPSPSLSVQSTSTSFSSLLADPEPQFGLSADVPSRVNGESTFLGVKGLRHVNAKLDARLYKSSNFATQLLAILVALGIPSWSKIEIPASAVKIFKVSGSLTNAVYFVSCPSEPSVRTLLLRIYGPSSGSLISRPRELHTLHVLSSEYRIGARVYGTFQNGRVEEYLDSVTLTPPDLRNKQISCWIGARMAELHSVDIAAVYKPPSINHVGGSSRHIGAKDNVNSWVLSARGVLALPAVSPIDRKALDMDLFYERWSQYIKWIEQTEKIEGKSKRVFAHNDTQYGNLLKLTKKLKEGTPEHWQIAVVDFEYASPNPLAFDIANHFHEWTADYHSSTPHILDPSRYPTLEERRNFYCAYLSHSLPSSSSCPPVPTPIVSEEAIMTLDRQVQIWSAASHGMWAIWGIVQARDDLVEGNNEPEFDYISYSRCRMELFYKGIEVLGI